jgi:serine/threonine protein phosphatase 1
MRQFAISDIHGCAVTLQALVEKKIGLRPQDELYLLGDYVDRGPNSKGVFDYIFQLQAAGYQVHCLRGNHEDLMLDAIFGGDDMELWRMNGGDTTMESFGAWFDIRKIPGRYWTFIESLPYYVELDGFFLVHAGLNFLEKNPLEDEHAMTWIRDWYQDLDWEWLGDRILIHGHTPQSRKSIESWPLRKLILPVLNIDAGCFYLGEMCAYNLTGDQLLFQQNLDMDLEEIAY